MVRQLRPDYRGIKASTRRGSPGRASLQGSRTRVILRVGGSTGRTTASEGVPGPEPDRFLSTSSHVRLPQTLDELTPLCPALSCAQRVTGNDRAVYRAPRLRAPVCPGPDHIDRHRLILGEPTVVIEISKRNRVEADPLARVAVRSNAGNAHGLLEPTRKDWGCLHQHDDCHLLSVHTASARSRPIRFAVEPLHRHRTDHASWMPVGQTPGFRSVRRASATRASPASR